MELYKQVVVDKEASESSFMALIALYKLHCPHLVPLKNPPARKVCLVSVCPCLSVHSVPVHRFGFVHLRRSWPNK